MICSVIIPTFNRQEILRKNLDYLACQKDLRGSLEVIIVDDGSTDSTEQVVASQIKSFSFDLRYFNTGLTGLNGVSVARNIGIREARSDRLVFLDDDLFASPYFLTAHLNALKKNLVVQGHVSHKKKKLAETPPVSVEEDIPLRFQDESRKDILRELISSNFSLHRKVFDLVGFFDERFAKSNEFGYEDIELGQRIFFSRLKIAFEKDALGYVPVDMLEPSPEKMEKRNRARKTWWEVINAPPEDSMIYPLLLARRDFFIKEQVK